MRDNNNSQSALKMIINQEVDSTSILWPCPTTTITITTLVFTTYVNKTSKMNHVKNAIEDASGDGD